MKKTSSSFYWYCANTCMCFGVASIFTAFIAITNKGALFEVTKPLAIISFLLVFPLFFAFVCIGIVSSISKMSKRNNKQEKISNLIKKSLHDLFEPIKILLSINKVHLVSTLILLVSALYVYKTHHIGGVHWNFGTPFERKHAISFGATAAMFYGIMLPFYSHKSSENALFSTES